MMLLAPFSSCCCYKFWLPFPPAAAEAFVAAAGPRIRTEKHPNCDQKLPNITSETHRKWCFWLLFPLAAAMPFSYLYIRSPNGKTPWKKSPPGGETPCLWRTEKPQNCTPKMPNVTSETHRKCCFWFLFPLAAAMNFGYLFLLLLQRLLLLLMSLDGKTPWQWRTEKP